MTAATVASFLISTVMVTWPVKGRMHLTSPAENAVNLKSGNGWSKTLPEETTGPPGGICWRPRCCASEAGGGSASAATRATVSNGADRGMTEPLSLPGAAPCDLVVSRAPGFRCAWTLPRRRHLRQIAPVLLIRRPAGSLHEFVNVRTGRRCPALDKADLPRHLLFVRFSEAKRTWGGAAGGFAPTL